LHKKELENIFNSYFHNQYNFQDFLNIIPKQNIHYKFNKYKNYKFISYIKENNSFSKDSMKMREYHTFIKNIFCNYMKVHAAVFSYRKHINIYDLAKIHNEHQNFFTTDIKSFFYSISTQMIHEVLIQNKVNFPFELDVKYYKNIVNITTVNNSLPVGYVTSPSISNAILYKFDELMDNYSQEHSISYSRYSDDLIFSSDDYNAIKSLPAVIESTLNSLYSSAFKLNISKTRFFDKTEKVSFLGISILPNGHITVEKWTKENISQLIYFYLNDKNKFTVLLQKRFKNNLSRAYGTLNYINDIDKQFILKLRKKYGNFIVDKFLHGVKH